MRRVGPRRERGPKREGEFADELERRSDRSQGDADSSDSAEGADGSDRPPKAGDGTGTKIDVVG